jgi:hypothetical protein
MARSRKSKPQRRRSPKRKSSRKRKHKVYGSKSKCRGYLSAKIRENMHELSRGRWKSRAQAIAVSYSMTAKAYPRCGRYLKRRK